MTNLTVQTMKAAVAAAVPSYVQEWHSSQITKDIHIRDVFAERILERSLQDSNFTVIHTLGSHAVGADLFVDRVGVSVKSGTTDRSDILTISGSRTSQYDSLSDKITFLEASKPNLFACFSHPKSQVLSPTAPPTGGVKYDIILFSSDVIDYGEASDWVDSGKRLSRSASGVNLRITHAMSGQVWYKLDLNVIEHERVTVTV